MNRLIAVSVIGVTLFAGAARASQDATGAVQGGVTSGEPNLMGWWPMDFQGSNVAPDHSGRGHDGILQGNPKWVEGYLGGALLFDGLDDYVDTYYTENLPRWTVSAWVQSPQSPRQGAVGGPVHREANFQFNWNHDDARFRGTAALRIGDTWHAASFGVLPANQWHHLAATFDGTSLKAYVNGAVTEANLAARGVPFSEPSTLKIGRHAGGPWYFHGTVDDVRVYNRALEQEEIEGVMMRHPFLAWAPRPANKSWVDIRSAAALTWTAGETAVAHDLYLGTDANAVETADMNSPLYWGRQAELNYGLTGLVDVGGRYFWRVDEVEADGTVIHKGVVWSFSVSGYAIIDDFESYTENEGRRIEETWIDGSANNTGSQVDRWVDPASTRRGDSGNKQALSLAYDNTGLPHCSETERLFGSEQDWTADLADTLSLSLKGDVVSFGEIADGTYAISASGSDIWSTFDQCRYAFKRLDGDGSISVQIHSVVMTDVWVKAGVMIRANLDPGSPHASMFVTPDGRRVFQNRLDQGSGFCYSAHCRSGTISLPYWVKVERRGNQFTGYHSADGVNWIRQPDNEEIVSGYQSPNPQTIDMPSTVYIGFALTSHNGSLTSTAVFSDVKTVGYVGTQWQVAEIGFDHPGNSLDDLYVVVEDAEGKAATAVNPRATVLDGTKWTEWRIPFTDFTGVDLRRVKRMCIGVGGLESSVPPGSGRILIDDILVWKP